MMFLIKVYKEQIKQIEQAIQDTIQCDPEVHNSDVLVRSVVGIGPVDLLGRFIGKLREGRALRLN